MNIFITKPEVEYILNTFGGIGDNNVPLEIIDIQHYLLAFTHISYYKERTENKENYNPNEYIPQDCNERLEFLGDSFVNAVVGKYLFDRFETSQEGFLTKLRTRLVRSCTMYKFARILQLEKYLLVSQQIENMTALGINKGRFNPRLYEDVFEAFIGAIIVDFGDEVGYKYAKRFIVRIIENLIDFSDLILVNENFKDIYQRYFQSMKWANPTYIDLENASPTYIKSFTSGTFINQQQLEHFGSDIQQKVVHFHQKQLQKFANRTDIINNIQNQQDLFLVGIATAHKKLVAEQNCSKQALLNLNINLQF